MKWCCSRYTTGVILGSVYTGCLVIYLIFKSISYLLYNSSNDSAQYREIFKYEAIKLIIILAVQAIISALFIVAIVKRYKYLIIPWLLMDIYNIYYTGLYGYFWFVGAAIAGPSIWFIVLVVVIAVLAIAIQIGIFWFSCTLFKEIHLENKKSKIQVPTSDPQMVEAYLI